MAEKIPLSEVNIPKVELTTATTGSVLNTAYFIAGAIMVLVIVVAGFFFVTSNGNPERIKVARNAILGAVIGIIVILTATAITAFVIRQAG